MAKLLVVFGITGQQGGSVARTVLTDPTLSSLYSVRGVTRDVKSAGQWKDKGVDLVSASLDDAASLEKAIKGAEVVYGLTTSPFDMTKMHIEIEQGKRLADAAVKAGAKYLIWSTTPSAKAISKGTLTEVGHFDAKKEVEDYIRKLPIRHAFYSPGPFMQNFIDYFRPIPMGDRLVIMNFVTPETQMPLVDIVEDSGKYVGLVLKNLDKYEGVIVPGAAGLCSFQEAAEILAKTTGKNVVYQQVPEDAWKSHLPEYMREEMAQMMLLFQDYGYWGEKTREMAEEGQKVKVTTMEEFARANASRMGLQ